MQGRPEGTETVASAWWRRRPRWQLTLAVFFGSYLLFRAVQGLVWLIGTV